MSSLLLAVLILRRGPVLIISNKVADRKKSVAQRNGKYGCPGNITSNIFATTFLRSVKKIPVDFPGRTTQREV